MEINYKSIGVINTPHQTKEGMPIQASAAQGIKGMITVDKEFMKGLQDLDGFSHIYLIYDFHKSKDYSLLTKPFLDDKEHGIFSTRAPKRPNSIGLSVVKLLSVKGNILEIENIDVLDGTPLLDIKPYIHDFDLHEVDKVGWYQGKTRNIASEKSDDRFS
ncbi:MULTISPECIES: tRNA (N6-threonylcarbamoyladenosine(37)-N6)-methyltransferase TrmO [unclassified Lentimicrobium]|uniref:tRNA (N6-threonylcarbamoyladenosine(37)-N6)-methyltransferase TrmO n=1 Tax=unclassified Lentimicrobium TaxID=2677434 RepID=UPI001556AEA9|nr:MULTISPECIES: tRNA (N6-threonylcarbamoyladenosine(37)-N6)-methyltransferase TrmO [unclassified Lentimicrobium]NPD48058.1 tRNA (N6-threonylcarbamoyladenosine(37)-N6)-methyltransferase TrmO [Lentimicrobium sp. S6]NPD86540.1 tRNA (N6-threonylcarbamoyladenosine(37)-N6)-methyltransferase TrmO [Lentimicrobium sp. L6]